ncbi:MAG: hypothetical protein MZV64_28960 [Ignavibacteriales bacterium]|nr:hypothetical protein [Ignavibacteriales bacterium]
MPPGTSSPGRRRALILIRTLGHGLNSGDRRHLARGVRPVDRGRRPSPIPCPRSRSPGTWAASSKAIEAVGTDLEFHSPAHRPDRQGRRDDRRRLLARVGPQLRLCYLEYYVYLIINGS